MTEHRGPIEEERPASSQEIALVRWMLEHGEPSAAAYLPEVAQLRVVSRCGCGCASVDFLHEPGAGLEILSDYQWEDELGHLFGVFVFAQRGKLAGLEVWSIDGQTAPSSLPDLAVLRPLAEACRPPKNLADS